MTILMRFNPVEHLGGVQVTGSMEGDANGKFVRYADAIFAARAIELRVAYLEDTLERISTEYPLAVEPCDCAAGAVCSVCEIEFLLEEFKTSQASGDS